VDAKPAFALGHSSPHPRIPSGQFEVIWTGLIHFRESGPVSFNAFVCGEVVVEIDGAEVLNGRGESERSQVWSQRPFERPFGLYRIAIRYRSLEGQPARVQIWWRGPKFAAEPLPAWVLKHDPTNAPDALKDEQLTRLGRQIIGEYGCARCHAGAFPTVDEPPPGPALSDAADRLDRDWLIRWLDNPSQMRSGARMPSLFGADRTAFIERSIVADYLLERKSAQPRASEIAGDHRAGRRQFIQLGCAACHFMPDATHSNQLDLGRSLLIGLGDRLPGRSLAEFLMNPHARYPDGRMPRLPMTRETAGDITAFLHLWLTPSKLDAASTIEPGELEAVVRRWNARRPTDAALAIIREKRCANCHPGIGSPLLAEIPLRGLSETRGCLSANSAVRFELDPPTLKAIRAYWVMAGQELTVSPFENRQRIVRRLGCLRCHSRDSDRPPPIELAGATLGGSNLETIPFQRTPRLDLVHHKYVASHLHSAVREGVGGMRHPRYSYRMPAFGDLALVVLQALAEADGDLLGDFAPEPPTSADPTLGPLSGPQLTGFQGYSCVSCHIWNGQVLAEPDPGAVGTDLTRLTNRIRRDWFDRFVENPLRFVPGTAMPSVFPHGQPATLRSVLDGDATRQRDAIWSYLALGKSAPPPKPAPPIPVATPSPGDSAIVAQIPLHISGKPPVESISILTSDSDLVVYDVGAASLRSVFVAGQIERTTQGRLRRFHAAGRAIGADWSADPPVRLDDKSGVTSVERADIRYRGYDRLNDGVRVRSEIRTQSAIMPMRDTVRVVRSGTNRQLVRECSVEAMRPGQAIEFRFRVPDEPAIDESATSGTANLTRSDEVTTIRVSADARGVAQVRISLALPPAETPQTTKWTTLADAGPIEKSPGRPGYRAIAYPRPKTTAGDDLIMPVAVAASPGDGRVFVASTKLGELFTVNDPTDDGRQAQFENYAHGLFQEPYSMLAESDAIYVLHRRNLTRVVDSDGDGHADQFDRVFATPQAVADAYDYGYGLVREPSGSFVFTLAPHANQELAGAGNALRLSPGGGEPEVVAYGFRNPLGWSSGPDGETFFTDNQGEWVATNKLCHLKAGRFFGYPNFKQRELAARPPGRAAIWVPYDWAHSINGVTYDNSAGKFGPFAGQIFMAELMFGGAIIRANLERVNGEYQGACFPFWGKGLLGPVTMAFDPRGRLWVGSITEPGWMAQPDRGALFRIDFTGPVPFEMQSIQVRPRGFRIRFTALIDEVTARTLSSYHIERYRYEYTGAYGSPELDRTRVELERAVVAPDGHSVDLTTSSLVQDQVYLISAQGIRSAAGTPLVHATGAYTLNEIPSRAD
jgi:glucose/arabinose dehydrogenase/cytochrome c551/c552